MGNFIPHQHVAIGTGVEIGDHHSGSPVIYLTQDDIIGLRAEADRLARTGQVDFEPISAGAARSRGPAKATGKSEVVVPGFPIGQTRTLRHYRQQVSSD